MSAKRGGVRKWVLCVSFLFLAGISSAQDANRPTKKTPPLTNSETDQTAVQPNQGKILASAKAPDDSQAAVAQEKLESDQVDKRAEWFYRQRSSVRGRIPAGARWNGYQHVMRMMAAEGKG